MPGIWTSFFRLFLFDSSKGEFTLAGIGQQYQRKLSAPKDAAKAFAGVPPENRKDFTKIYTAVSDLSWWNYEIDTKIRHPPVGIHMSCWKLVQWKLGPGVAKNLELFIAIALQTNFKILSKFGVGNVHPFRLYEMATMNNSRYDDMQLKQAEIMTKNIYEWPDRVDYDPFRNPCTQNIIDLSRRFGKRVSFAQPLIPDLPLEILFEILDFLDCKEISILGIAFRIVIPDCYWRSRAALNLIGFDETAEEDLNWEYLCLKFEVVYAKDEKLESRRYILDLLSNIIEPVYLQDLGKRDFPRLEEVIDECQDKIEWRSYQHPHIRCLDL